MDSIFKGILHKRRAFTLIELLIVIAIIAILTVAFLPTLRGGQVGARNAARKSAVNDMVLAIERIANGDVPVGVNLGTASAGKIPPMLGASANGCLDFTKELGKDVRNVLAANPSVQTANVTLCGGGYFYKAFKSDGAATTFAGDTATNYLIAVQVEGDNSNGNVSGTAITIDATGAGLTGAFDIWANALARTTGTSTNPLWVVTK